MIVIQFWRYNLQRKKGIVGVYDGEDPPVPIPNTVVKLAGAENTWLETARENRAMPTLLFFIYTEEFVREILNLKASEYIYEYIVKNNSWCK